MFSGVNPKMMKQAMKKLGMKQEEVDAYEVIIKTSDGNLVIRNPQVSIIEGMGQKSIQVVGDIEKEKVISGDDVKTVASQAKVSERKAKKALEECGGDLAEAILSLKKEYNNL